MQDFIINNHKDLKNQLELKLKEDYSLTVYDFHIMYIPSYSHLENIQIIES